MVLDVTFYPIALSPLMLLMCQFWKGVIEPLSVFLLLCYPDEGISAKLPRLLCDNKNICCRTFVILHLLQTLVFLSDLYWLQ